MTPAYERVRVALDLWKRSVRHDGSFEARRAFVGELLDLLDVLYGLAGADQAAPVEVRMLIDELAELALEEADR